MLQDAIRKKEYDTAKELIEKGDPFAGMQPYHITGIFDTIIRDKAFGLVDTLVAQGAIELDIYEYDSFDKSIFKSIVNYLDTEAKSLTFLNAFLSQLENINDELESKSLLSYALENEVDLSIIKAMVDNGCDIQFTTKAEENLIHQIIKKYVRNYDRGLQYLNYFLEEGLEIDKPNTAQKTPLHLAVEFHKNEYIQWLLANGADANATDKNDESPFFIALAHSADLEKYQIMREYDAPQFDAVNKAGESLLYQCIRMGCSPELLKLLLEDGADLYQTSMYYQRSVTAVDVIAEKHLELLQVALDSGRLEVNRKDDQGDTILHKVCGRETLNEEKRAKEVYRMVKALVAAGADPSASNDKDETPMMVASKDDLKAKTVAFLLAKK